MFVMCYVMANIFVLSPYKNVDKPTATPFLLKSSEDVPHHCKYANIQQREKERAYIHLEPDSYQIYFLSIFSDHRLENSAEQLKLSYCGLLIYLYRRHTGYKKVYLPLYEVADTPFHIQGDKDLYLTIIEVFVSSAVDDAVRTVDGLMCVKSEVTVIRITTARLRNRVTVITLQ